MPVEIFLSKENETGTETILKSELKDGEEIVEEVKKEKDEDPDKVKITGADADLIINYIISNGYDMAKAVTPKKS